MRRGARIPDRVRRLPPGSRRAARSRWHRPALSQPFSINSTFDPASSISPHDSPRMAGSPCLHGPGPRPAEDRGRAAHSKAGADGRREAVGCRRCRQALHAAAAGGHEDRGDGRDHAPARSRAQGCRRSHPRGRHRQGVREARRQRCGSEPSEHRRCGGGALARTLAGRARAHRGDGPEP